MFSNYHSKLLLNYWAEQFLENGTCPPEDAQDTRGFYKESWEDFTDEDKLTFKNVNANTDTTTPPLDDGWTVDKNWRNFIHPQHGKVKINWEIMYELTIAKIEELSE